MFDALEKWGRDGVLPVPVVQTICDVHSQGIEGVKKAFFELAERKAIGKIVLQWHPDARL